jgi:cytochrome b561
MKNNEEHHFGIVTILLHWGMALAIFFLFGLGLYMVDLTYYDPWYRDSTALHKSIGLCVFMLLIFRIFWRVNNALVPSTVTLYRKQKSLEQKIAVFVHMLLYVFVAFLCFSGYFIATAGGREVDFFSWFSLPPLPVEIENQEDLAGAWHYYLAWALIGLATLHALAALKHHFINHDNTLKNMLKPSKIKNGDR